MTVERGRVDRAERTEHPPDAGRPVPAQAVRSEAGDASRAQIRRETAEADRKLQLDRAPPEGDGDGPHPELSERQRDVLEQRRQELTERYSKDYARLSHDPDRGGPNPKGRIEAATALHLRERGLLPRDVDRPPGPDMGDFVATVDGRRQHWDIKQFRDRWPESVREPEGRPYTPAKGGYSSEQFVKKVGEQLAEGRTVILDTRSVRQETIDDMVRIVREQGWGSHVKWYP
ncbi:hypothetical protein [Polymorphospora rubra]|uniref:hypothetical protein n=1 Tax=Polymorphospora rubra TaxID=338584 RepID=UPI0033EF14EA